MTPISSCLTPKSFIYCTLSYRQKGEGRALGEGGRGFVICEEWPAEWHSCSSFFYEPTELSLSAKYLVWNIYHTTKKTPNVTAFRSSSLTSSLHFIYEQHAYSLAVAIPTHTIVHVPHILNATSLMFIIGSITLTLIRMDLHFIPSFRFIWRW